MTYTASASTYWPTERIDQMRELIGRGMTSRQIGAQMGVSHRAVLSKCSRLGIALDRKPEWTAEQTQRLRELATQDLSASQIGAALGVTKNAALGKMHREGIPMPRPKLKTRKGRSRPQPHKIRLYDGWRTPRQTASRGLGQVFRDQAVHLPPGLIDLPAEPTAATAVDIIGLTPTSCRWPLGEPTADMLYCGATIGVGSYCPFHTMKAFRPRGA